MLLHACIFAAYAELGNLVGVWADKCSSFAVVEHPADGKTKRVHCHFLMESSMADDDPFRSSGKKELGDFFKRGNYWIASRVQKGPHAGKLLEKPQTLVYMLKGKFTPKFAKNISQEEVETSRQSWVEKVNSDETEVNPTEHFIREVVAMYDRFPTYQAYLVEHELKYEDMLNPPSPSTMLLDDIRHGSYSMLYRHKHMAPHAQFYKQIASTAFLRVMEKWGRLDEGIHKILNLWK